MNTSGKFGLVETLYDDFIIDNLKQKSTLYISKIKYIPTKHKAQHDKTSASLY